MNLTLVDTSLASAISAVFSGTLLIQREHFMVPLPFPTIYALAHELTYNSELKKALCLHTTIINKIFRRPVFIFPALFSLLPFLPKLHKPFLLTSF